MNRRVATAVALAAFLVAAVTVCAADDATRVLTLRGASLDSGAPVSLDAAKTAAALVVKRCAHAGVDGVTSAVSADGSSISILIAPGTDAREAEVRRFFRRGLVEFRARAATSVEDTARDARLQAGSAAPSGFAWCLPESGVLQLLIETPERPLAEKVRELRKKQAETSKDDHETDEQKKAQAEYDQALADSVFTNAQMASASVQRSMSSWGAQRFMRVVVRFEFREDRRAAFEKFTGAHVGRDLCVILDGKVHLAAGIPAAMPGGGELRAPGTGYTEVEAQEMAAILESGPLPCALVPAKDK